MARGYRKLVRRRKQLNRKLAAKSLRLETLEARQLLATFTWDGSAGDNLLINPENWDQNDLPGAGDDVVFQDAGAGILTLDGNATQVNSITFENSLGNDFTLADGSIAVNAITQTGSGSNKIDMKIVSPNLVGEVTNGHLALTDTSNDIQGTWTVVGSSEGADQIDSWTVTSEGDHDDPWAWVGGAFTTDGSTGDGNDHTRLTSPVLTVPSNGALELSFDHHYSIEGGNWDGGAVFVSVNSGAFEQIPAVAFTANGYTAGPLIGNHALLGRDAFGGDSPGYPENITSVATIGTFNAGDEIQVQFLMANDEGAVGNFTPNWAIDDVRIDGLMDHDFELTVGTLAVSGEGGASSLGSATIIMSGGKLDLAAPEGGTGIGAPRTMTESSNTEFPVSADDLIEGVTPTLAGAGLGGQEGTSSNADVLTDGAFGGAGLDDAAELAATVSISNNTTLTYALDTAANPNGYDIAEVSTYAGWRDPGRDNQDYTVRYATVDDPGTFVDLETVSYNPGGIGNPASTAATVDAGAGILATRVGAVQFAFGTQENGYVGYRELDVVGTPSPLSSRTDFTFDGNPTDLDGWTVSSGLAGEQGGRPGEVTAANTQLTFAHDAAHDTYRLTSPTFTLNGSGDLTFVMRGGTSGGNPGTPAPANLAALPATSQGGGGWQGVAVRDLTNDDYVLAQSNVNGNNNNYNSYNFSAAQLAALETANPGRNYALEFIDFFDGGWGWVTLDEVHIPPAPTPPFAINNPIISSQGASSIVNIAGLDKAEVENVTLNNDSELLIISDTAGAELTIGGTTAVNGSAALSVSGDVSASLDGGLGGDPTATFIKGGDGLLINPNLDDRTGATVVTGGIYNAATDGTSSSFGDGDIVVDGGTVQFTALESSLAVATGAIQGDFYDLPGSGTSALFGATLPTGLDSLTPVSTLPIDVIRHPSTGGNPFAEAGLPVNVPNDDHAARWTGFVNIPEDATYRFYTESDDGSMLYINGNLLVDNNGDHGMQTRQGDIVLTAGFHEFYTAFYERAGGSGMIVTWEQLDGANPFGRRDMQGDDFASVTFPPLALPNNVVGNSGGALALSPSFPTVQFNGLTLNDGSDLSISAGSEVPVTFVGDSQLSGNGGISLQGDFAVELKGVVSGDALTKGGSGELILSNANTYAGLTSVTDGRLVAANDAALGTADGGTNVSAGAALILSGGIDLTNEPVHASGTGPDGNGAIVNQSGDSRLGTLTATAGRAISLSSLDGTLTVDGDVSLELSDLLVFGSGHTVINGSVSGSIPSTPPDYGALVTSLNAAGYYSFDNVDGTIVNNEGTTGAEDNGNMQNGATIATGVMGDGLAIANANNQRLLLDTGGIDIGPDGWTASIWFNGIYPTNSWRTMFRGQSNDHQMLIENGSRRMGVYDNANGAFRASGFDVSSIENDGQWHALTVRGNSGGGGSADSTTDLFIDGVMVGTSDRRSVTEITAIGNCTCDGQQFGPLLDELAIFTTALTDEEIQSLANPLFAATNSLVKQGTGTLTLTGNNTYAGETTVVEGTLVVDSDNALGTADEGTNVSSGAALGLSGGITFASETVTIAGSGPNGDGALVNVSGDNTLAADLITVGSVIGIGSLDGALTVNRNLDLGLGSLRVSGAGDVILNGDILGVSGGNDPSLLNLNDFDTGDYSFTADGQTFEALVDNDGTNSWILVGRGRNNWDFDQDGPNSDPDLVNDDLGTVDAFTPTAFSHTIINDLMGQSGLDMTQIEVRLSRASDVNGTNPYQEYRWRDFTGNGNQWTWDFDDSQYGMTLEVVSNDGGVPGTDIGVGTGKNTRDSEIGGNDGDRVFTWAWDGHGNQRGFSYGSTVGGVDNNDPNTFLWEFGGENHTIPYTEVYIRSLATTASSAITKDGGGTLTLNGDNSTFAGSVEILGGTLVATNDTSLGSSSNGTSLNGGVLELNGGVNVADEELSTSGDASAIRNLAGDSTVGDITMDSDLTIWSEGGLLVVSGDINMGFANLSFDGSGDTRVEGTISDTGILPRMPETGGALLASVYINGDTSDNAVFNIGVPGADSLLTKIPIQSLPITQRIDFRDDGQFRSFFTDLQQDDNYQTTFEGIVNIPDVNGDGSAVNVEFGSNRGDDPVAVFVDLNQNGVFESSQGENVAQRGCCGSVYATVSLEPGSYRYLAAHAERGGGSQIEPTINLGPPLSIDIPGQSISPVFQSWSTAPTSVISEAVRYGDGAGGNLDGCAPFAADSLAGDVVLVDRGACTFTSKIFNIANGGGVAGIIGLIDGSAPFDGGFADPGGPITIPGYMISQADANAIRDALPTTATINPGRQTINPGAMGDLFIIQEGRESGPVRVMGTGTVVFAGDNTYHVDTIVENGTLLAANSAGSATGDGAVTIMAGGTLGGDGSVSGDVVAQAGGATSPGLAPGQAATLSTGNYTLEPGSFGIKELTSSGHDQTNVTGTVTLTDAIAVGIMETGYRPVNGETFVLINNDGNDPIVGELVGIPEGGLAELSNGDTNRLFSVSYVGGDGNDFEVTYINRAPVYDAGGPYTIGEGDSLTLDASASSDADLDPISYSWDVNGDGVFGDATGVNPTLTWDDLNALGIDDGPASFNVTVMGDDGELSGDASTTLTLDNVAPTAEIDGDTMGVPNRPLSFTLRALFEASQPDRNAGYTYVVDWADGSVDTFGPGETDTVFVEHSFGDFGELDVVLTVTDKDGGSSTATLPVDISPVAQIGDTLYVGGTDGKNDRIEVRRAGLEQIDVRYNDIRFGRFQPARVVIFGGDGKDRITVNATIPAEVHGEEGADYIALSSADDVVFGGPGRDTILVGSGNNWVDGGEGNDNVIAREGNDELNGGAGNDRMDGGSGDDILRGDAGNDQLVGGNGNDLLVGGAGNDAAFGQGGQDVIIGGDGNDKNRGGSGDDFIIGGFGNDGLQGERGDDTLNSGDAQLADDSDAQLALLAEWVSSRSYNSIGSFFDDGDKDGMDGGGGPDEIYFGSNDSLSLVRDNDSLFLL